MTDEVTAVSRAHGVARIRLLSGGEIRIPSAIFTAHPLRAGQMVDTDAYRVIMDKEGMAYALNKAIALQSMRDHTQMEIRLSLRRSAYPEEIIEKTVALLSTGEIISDQRFSEGWVRRRSRTHGRSHIRQEMRMKGVDEETAEMSLEDFSREDELDAAVARAEKLLRQGKDEQHTLQALMRRGYDYSMCRKALAEAQKTSES